MSPMRLAALLILILFGLTSHAAGEVSAIDSFRELAKEGTLLRLQGDYGSAAEIESRLINEADSPIGHIFAINTMVTRVAAWWAGK